ncbi:MAG: hypothetical protein GC200_06410 [Tepidisphaera sp.]|nr:hypothetical protein [Tepidisphaera sp.]
MSEMLFEDAGAVQHSADARLIDAYIEIGRTLDDLPYTQDFESLLELVAGGGFGPVAQAGQVGRNIESPREGATRRRETFHRLQNLRKAGKLPKLGRAESAPSVVEPEEERFLIELVVGAVGTLGQRDQLLYDEKFDQIVAAFNGQTGRSLTPHTLWRLVAKLAK